MATSRAAKSDRVEVTFSLPAGVGAERVALCGEFNGWSADDIHLEKDGDGSWHATVALVPGRTYRYRHLIDGQRWETGGTPTAISPSLTAATTRLSRWSDRPRVPVGVLSRVAGAAVGVCPCPRPGQCCCCVR
jgi:1,4-alpha-glucan branching enzyme